MKLPVPCAKGKITVAGDSHTILAVYLRTAQLLLRTTTRDRFFISGSNSLCTVERKKAQGSKRAGSGRQSRDSFRNIVEPAH